jgi:GNAT superfamily N-acetyltransferase
MQDLPNRTPLPPAWTVLTTRTGLRLYVRPVERDDRDRLEAFLDGLAHEDLRFRFLTPLARPSRSLLDALVAVDHVRTEDYLAFAEADGKKALVASAMLAADPNMERAEVAIAVRPDHKQCGVGWTLLDFVARNARARGIKRLESIECRDNRAAIGLEQEMGFTAGPYPGDPGLTLVCKELARPAAAETRAAQ